jgi:hypothetical protein
MTTSRATAWLSRLCSKATVTQRASCLPAEFDGK